MQNVGLRILLSPMPDSVVFDCLQSFTMQETINFFLGPYIKGL
jgi:hypothetical protein